METVSRWLPAGCRRQGRRSRCGLSTRVAGENPLTRTTHVRLDCPCNSRGLAQVCTEQPTPCSATLSTCSCSRRSTVAASLSQQPLPIVSAMRPVMSWQACRECSSRSRSGRGGAGPRRKPRTTHAHSVAGRAQQVTVAALQVRVQLGVSRSTSRCARPANPALAGAPANPRLRRPRRPCLANQHMRAEAAHHFVDSLVSTRRTKTFYTYPPPLDVHQGLFVFFMSQHFTGRRTSVLRRPFQTSHSRQMDAPTFPRARAPRVPARPHCKPDPTQPRPATEGRPSPTPRHPVRPLAFLDFSQLPLQTRQKPIGYPPLLHHTVLQIVAGKAIQGEVK